MGCCATGSIGHTTGCQRPLGFKAEQCGELNVSGTQRRWRTHDGFAPLAVQAGGEPPEEVAVLPEAKAYGVKKWR